MITLAITWAIATSSQEKQLTHNVPVITSPQCGALFSSATIGWFRIRAHSHLGCYRTGFAIPAFQSLSVMTNVTLGEFFDRLPDTQEYLTLGFSPSAQARKVRWRNYGLSADFLGDYFATFFPGSDSVVNQFSEIATDHADGGTVEQPNGDRQETVKACISYVANELIENAIKFSDERSITPVTISLYLYESSIVLLSRNNTTVARSSRFREHIQLILDNDIEHLYTQRLEEVSVGSSNESCLGLISMMADYGVRLGWQFIPSNNYPESVEVSVMAHLSL